MCLLQFLVSLSPEPFRSVSPQDKSSFPVEVGVVRLQEVRRRTKRLNFLNQLPAVSSHLPWSSWFGGTLIFLLFWILREKLSVTSVLSAKSLTSLYIVWFGVTDVSWFHCGWSLCFCFLFSFQFWVIFQETYKNRLDSKDSNLFNTVANIFHW